MSGVRQIAGLIVSSFFAIGLQAQELPFLDGFDDPADDLWTLERSWQLHADENVSTLHGRGHSWARLRAEPQWSDYALRTRISLDVGGIHIVFRHGEQGRYFFGVRDDVAYLQKESPWGTFKELAIREQDMELGRWFDVEIRAQRGRLRIYRDEELLFDVTDDSPLLTGSIAFETLDDSSAYIDFVDVHSDDVDAARESFFERRPFWDTPDLALLELTAKPARAAPGELVRLDAIVANRGRGTADDGAELSFIVNDEVIAVRSLQALDPAGEQRVSVEWAAEAPGPHDVLARVGLPGQALDTEPDNDQRAATVWIAGEASPGADLEVRFEPDLQRLVPGRPYAARLELGNPGFGDLEDVPVQVVIDGDVVHETIIDRLAGGENRDITFEWSEVRRGSHIVEVLAQLPGERPTVPSGLIKSWSVVIPSPTILHTGATPDQWVSLGPRTIKKGIGALTTGSVGRIHHIALHPTHAKTLYASTPRGGVWKSRNGGSAWLPLGDRLPSWAGGPIAIDPNFPSVIYYATGYPWNSQGVGIFKSVDGGTNWDLFANAVSRPGKTDLPIRGTSQIVIYYPSANSKQLTIYAATDVGVLRYTNSNPWATTSTAGQWAQIKTGKIADMAADPKNPSVLYASVVGNGVWRTKTAATASGNGGWTKLSKGLPNIVANKTGAWFTLDVYRHDPQVLYAALAKPGVAPGIAAQTTAPTLGIYKSINGGDSWNPENIYTNGGLYNAFVKAHPYRTDIVYFGGVKLYKNLFSGSAKAPKVVGAIHADMHSLVWDHHTKDDNYYITNDGGIWYCKVNTGVGDDVCQNRNWDLRVTELFDIDSSSTDSKLMIGGTQDNGTILYQGTPDWKFVKDSDGRFSLIAPGNKILYAQHQALSDTRRCDAGANCWVNTWKDASLGLPKGDKWAADRAFISVNPIVPWWLLSQGPQVYTSRSWGSNWYPIGPTGKSVKGHITRALFHPSKPANVIIAGTSTGQLWMGTTSGQSVNWKMIWDRSAGSGNASIRNMAFSPADPDLLYVVFDGGADWAQVYQFELDVNPPGAIGLPITGNFPNGNRSPRVIAGDANRANVAYVGTERGVFRGEAPHIGGTWVWTDFNDGLPLVEVTDLLVDATSGHLRAATRGRGAWTVATRP